ncbi:regulator of nucleoside diphosphate kinase [Paucimonas lemoignei]|uniref:Regulator of nucleoside diphosphate kinase n=1 Tax=Paucimonas lemoignei TaxID=29443 RepID=A0A4R3I2T3_PAULE|nr:nucleoside diphosphate kinase regulator [Paucimonas lemoignei]TCS39343.1 regulator of nucleoside diphosphate kinase [Paucimonas lemoignei]
MNAPLEIEQFKFIVTTFDLERIEEYCSNFNYRNLDEIKSLREKLDLADIVSPQEVPADVVTMHSTVTFFERAADAEYQYTLVYPGVVNPAGTISVFTPVGSALLGMSKGQTLNWRMPGRRELCLRVLDVTNQPEAAGMYYR